MLARWIAITEAQSFRNLVEIRSIPEGFTASVFFKILSTVVTSTLYKTRPSHSFWICLYYSSVVLISHLFFGHGSFCSSGSPKFDKKQQKIFALSFELKQTTLFSLNEFLDPPSPISECLDILKFARVL